AEAKALTSTVSIIPMMIIFHTDAVFIVSLLQLFEKSVHTTKRKKWNIAPRLFITYNLSQALIKFSMQIVNLHESRMTDPLRDHMHIIALLTNALRTIITYIIRNTLLQQLKGVRKIGTFG